MSQTDLNELVAQQAAAIRKLEARLQRLDDIEAIKVLQRTYGYLLDKALWADMADLFTADGEIEIGGRGVYRGHERIHLFLARQLREAQQALDDDEVLTVERLPFTRALAMVRSGEIDDAKSIAALHRAAAELGLI